MTTLFSNITSTLVSTFSMNTNQAYYLETVDVDDDAHTTTFEEVRHRVCVLVLVLCLYGC